MELIQLERVKEAALRSEEERVKGSNIQFGSVILEKKEERVQEVEGEEGNGRAEGDGVVKREGKGCVSEEEVTWRYLPLQEDVTWASRCSIAKLKHRFCLTIVRQSLIDAGFVDYKLITLGGDVVLLQPTGQGVNEARLLGMNDLLHNFMEGITPWTSDDMRSYVRGAWVRCYGIPLHAWNPIFFAEIAESQGRLLKVDECTLNKDRMDFARILIATPSLQDLNFTISVQIEDKVVCLHIVEEQGSVLAEDACLFECAEDIDSQFSVRTGVQEDEPIVDAFVDQLHADWITKEKRKKAQKEVSSKSKSSGKQGTSLSTGSGTGAKYLKSQDWKSWVALHGDSKKVKDDVAELGENIGVKCSNSFQALARGRGSGSSKGRILSYNVRCLGAVEKRREFRRLISERRVDVLCIQESKMEVVEESLIRYLWGSDSDNVDFFLANVYAPCESAGRVNLWNGLGGFLQQHQQVAGCVLGDFNAVRSQEERRSRQVSELGSSAFAYVEVLVRYSRASMNWQKSRINWLREGDANSKFFHGIMSSRKRCNSIASFTVDGISIEGVAEVRQHVFDHFQNHFRKVHYSRPDISGLSFSTVSELEREELTKPFLLEEIKSAIWDCDSFKSPGPDGVNLGFFKDFWESAFIKGRQILDVVLIANEIVDDAKSNKKDLLLFKVDFEKAYDSVDWDYLSDVMTKMNFPSVWRGWIMECVTSASASVLVNGCPTDEFHFERGLRQGDPLSPFLFLLTAEGLHVLMEAMVSNSVFTPYGIGLQNSVSISHLQFADDTLLIGEKTSVMCCKYGQLPFLYLGLSIGGDPRKLNFWYPLVDRIRNRLSGWKCKNLSIGGRLILLKSVFSSIPIYYLSFFSAPPGKWVWRLLVEHDSLWSMVLKAKYSEEGGRVRFDEGVGSVWWRSLNRVRSGAGLLDSRWLKDNLIRKIGNGREALFWKDPWLDDCSLARSFGRLFDLAENKLITVHDMYEAGWGVGGEAWKWRRRLYAWEEDLVFGVYCPSI
ncbi:hypothetical protein TSUD_401590 [Trifolium subterraneum]|uniref:Reverse transcriptase domain-containing protein n=1 Tax=Trifolium subterraneum TaxID=3900 RepID=A0A2Z6PBL7_TRISU|nr:hypothetical protein TSUD_401590 [Trifolium subterraneum]